MDTLPTYPDDYNKKGKQYLDSMIQYAKRPYDKKPQKYYNSNVKYSYRSLSDSAKKKYFACLCSNNDNSNKSTLTITLPKNITHLSFDNNFNGPIPSRATTAESVVPQNFIPSTVIYINFGNKFNQPLTHIIPKSARCLIFGIFYDQSIEPYTIPDSVQYLKFGCYFNQKIIQNVLPVRTKPNVGCKLAFCLPKNLKYLIFGRSFNQKIKSNVIQTRLNFLYLITNLINRSRKTQYQNQ